MNGVLEPDRFHSVFNGAKKAMQAVGLWPLSLATTVVQKAKRGPFGGAGFLGSLKECVAHHSTVADHTDPVFVFFYERISLCFDGGRSHDFGSRDHQEATYQR